MFLKWTGGLLILFAGSGMGVWLAWGYKKRLQTIPVCNLYRYRII